jgi:hypothetical protein
VRVINACNGTEWNVGEMDVWAEMWAMHHMARNSRTMHVMVIYLRAMHAMVRHVRSRLVMFRHVMVKGM